MLLILALFLDLAGIIPQNQGALAINYGYLISDSTFESQSSNISSAASIDGWLNSRYPSGCISGSFRTPDPTGWNGTAMTFGSNVTAGRAIYDAGRIYNINPQVLLSTLQKEQSAISGGAGCYPNTPDPASATPMTNKCGSGTRQCTLACTHAGGCLTIAVGYGCPNYCDVRYEGFSKQIIWGANTFRFAQMRSRGILTGYTGHDPGDEDLYYSGPMTRGYRKRSASSPNTYYDGTYTPNDGGSVTIATGGTASLYNYTPFKSGNTNFNNIFTGWFGSPTSPCYATTNLASTPSGRHFVGHKNSSSGPTNLTFTRLNNSGSACTEAHLWNSGYKSWATNIITGMQATDPSSGILVSGNLLGDSRNDLTFIHYGGSGFTAVHVFSSDLKLLPGYYDVLTNLNNVTATSGTFVTGNFDGKGKDELTYVKFGGSVEIHKFSSDLRKAIGTYDVLTNLSGISSTTGEFVAGDFLGRGYDQLAYVKYTGSAGRVEVHIFSRDLRTSSGIQDVITNLAGFDPST